MAKAKDLMTGKNLLFMFQHGDITHEGYVCGVSAIKEITYKIEVDKKNRKNIFIFADGEFMGNVGGAAIPLMSAAEFSAHSGDKNDNLDELSWILRMITNFNYHSQNKNRHAKIEIYTWIAHEILSATQADGNNYAKESYAGMLGKYAGEALFTYAIMEASPECSPYLDNFSIDTKNNNYVHLYKGNYYITEKMMRVIFKSMYEDMTTEQQKSYNLYFNIKKFDDAYAKSITEDIYNRYIVNDLRIYSDEIKFIANRLKPVIPSHVI